MSKAKIKPDQSIVKRLLMRIDPLFFSYDKSKQDQERQSYFHRFDDVITEFLFKYVFEIEFEKDVQNEEKLSKKQLDLFNAYITSLTGVGENSFVYNEFQSKDFNLGIYPTLYDYDLEEFQFQRNARYKDSNGDIIDIPYRLYLNNNWCRILDSEGYFYYSTQTSLSHYLYQRLSEYASDRMEQLIPHCFVDGPDNGKRTKGGYLCDFKLNANGLEAQLEELKNRYRCYLNDLLDVMNETFHGDSECVVYFERSTTDDEPRWDVIINNAQTAKNISFQTYLKDCEKYLKPNEKLEDLYQEELEMLDAYINENFNDIMKNFDQSESIKKKLK